jgi:hypothetical protein
MLGGSCVAIDVRGIGAEPQRHRWRGTLRSPRTRSRTWAGAVHAGEPPSFAPRRTAVRTRCPTALRSGNKGTPHFPKETAPPIPREFSAARRRLRETGSPARSGPSNVGRIVRGDRRERHRSRATAASVAGHPSIPTYPLPNMGRSGARGRAPFLRSAPDGGEDAVPNGATLRKQRDAPLPEGDRPRRSCGRSPQPGGD